MFALRLHAQVEAKMELFPASDAVSRGTRLKAHLVLEIAPGWHIASITQADGGPMRTEVNLSEKQPFILADRIISPVPHIEHSQVLGMDIETYSGVAVFTLPLIAAENCKVGTKITAEVTYQACSEKNCLLPQTQKVTAVVGTKREVTPKGMLNARQ